VPVLPASSVAFASIVLLVLFFGLHVVILIVPEIFPEIFLQATLDDADADEDRAKVATEAGKAMAVTTATATNKRRM
jgi:hypothetical protein